MPTQRMLQATKVTHSHYDGDEVTLEVDVRISSKWNVPVNHILLYVDAAIREWEDKQLKKGETSGA